MSKYRKVVFLGDTIIGSEPLGIQRYAAEILKELDKMKFPYEAEVLIPDVESCSLKLDHIKIVRIGKKGRTGFLWRQLEYPKYVKREKAISVDLTLGLSLRGSDIVCLHDCIYENYPDDFVGFKEKIKRLSYLIRVRQNIRKAQKIITVSKTSKMELINYYRIPEDQIEVIYNAWQHIKHIQIDDSILRRLYIQEKKYYFSLGSKLPHKNFRWIIEAAKQNPGEIFVVTGSNKLSQYDYGNMNIKNVLFTGYLTDAEIKALLSNCKCFIFPSLYEGFGIPPLEALACGADILISNKSCLPEIYGNSAAYFDPLKYNSIAIEDTHKAIEKKQNVLNRYSWYESASKLERILESMWEE